MKNRILSLLILIMLPLGRLHSTEFLVTPKDQKGVTQLTELFLCESVLQVEDIFSSSDKTFLLSNGSLSAYTQKVSVVNDKDFRKCLTSLGHLDGHENFSVSLKEDPLSKEQWGIDNSGQTQEIDITDIDVVQVHGQKGIDIGIHSLPKEDDRGIVVAVLDTGVDYTHPDLKGAIYHNKSECDALLQYEQCLQNEDADSCNKKWANVDSDGNGYPLDCAGWNVLGNGIVRDIKGNNDASDSIGHGTHIAGIIAARKNGIGIEGVSQQVKILPVRVMGDMQGGMSDDQLPSPSERTLPAVSSYADLFARGLLYAIRSHVDVINMSLGWSRSVDSILMRDLVKLAIKQGILIVAAAGNDATDSPIYPCIYDDVICVGAFSSDATVSTFSNYGANVDLMAPGHKILSTWPEKLIPRYYTERRGYEFKNGTSMAAPFVAGALGRLLNYGLSKEEALARLLLSTSPMSEKTQEKFSQFGRLDLRSALSLKPTALFSTVKKGVHYIVWDGSSESVDFSVALKNIWEKSEKIHAEVSFVGRLMNAKQQVSLNVSDWGSIDSHQQLELQGRLKGLDLWSPSEYTLKIDLTGNNFSQTVYVNLETILPLTNSRHHPQQITFGLDKKLALDANSQIRTFNRSRNDNDLSYLIIKRQGRLNQLSALTFYAEEGTSSLSAPFAFRGKVENIVGLWQLDIDQDGKRDFVLAERVLKTVRNSDSRTSSNMINFYFFDSSFHPKRVTLLGQTSNLITYDNQKAVIDKDFKWLPANGMLVPAWVGKGESTKPTPIFNPWSSEQGPVMGRYLYYFGQEKLESVEFNTDYKLLGLLPSEGGIQKLYFAKGAGFLYEFFTLSFEDISAIDAQFNSIMMSEHYFMLGGLEVKKVSHSSAISFTDISNDGLEVGVMDSDNNLSRIHSIKQYSFFDPIHAIAGIGEFQEKLYTYAIGKYNLYLYENDQFLSSTSLKRFSFLPGMTFDQFLFPVTDDKGKLGIYFPGSLGVSLSSEVMTVGEDQKLYRPAGYRILATDGCQELNHVQLHGQDHLTYLCGENLRLIPLDFK